MPVESVGANNFSKLATAQPKYSKAAAPQTPVNTAPAAKPEANKKSKTPYVAGAIALAAIAGVGIYGHKQGWFKKAAKPAENIISDGGKAGGAVQPKGKNNTPVASSIEKKIANLKAKFKSDADRVVNENRKGTMIDLEALDEAAGRKSADLTLGADRFHQAASWIETAYVEAYKTADLKGGKNMFDYIAERIGDHQRLGLPTMYVQMPKEEAEVRLMQFAKNIEAENKGSKGKTTLEQFVKNMKEHYMPAAQKKIEENNKKQ